MVGRVVEMNAPGVVERARVALEALGEAPVRRGSAPARRPRVLGHEAVGPLALGDVEVGGGLAAHALGEDAHHEQRVVADVPAHVHLVLGTKLRRVDLPRGLDLQHHVDDVSEARQRERARVEVLGAREAGEQIGEVRSRRIAVEREVMKARADHPLEEPSQLHTRAPASRRG